MTDRTFLGREDLYLFNSGKLQRAYLKFGAQVLPDGVHFALWAPHARQVRLVGDFNGWNGEGHRMRPIGSAGQTGVWALFVPGLGPGERYKYEITAGDGSVLLKADPFAFQAELRPNTASVTCSLAGYAWSEEALSWEGRSRSEAEPMLIYEVHFGSWKRHPDGAFYSYRELARDLIPYITHMGYTHVEIMPLMEHPLDASWGYQITGYYALTSRYGSPHDFMYFVDQCHQAGIGVILDWVPGHFCRDIQGLGRFDGEPLFDGGDHADWGTYRFDFARSEVWSFLISNALFWFDIYRIDGLRVDGVTSMLYRDFVQAGGYQTSDTDGNAIAFLRALNGVVSFLYPNRMMIAEESSKFPKVSHPESDGGLGFNYKWNMGWMNDTLRYAALPFADRPAHHELLTFSLLYAFSERFILPFSHDEVVHGKRSLLGRMPGDYWQQFAGLRALYCYFLTHPGKKICFMGTELAPFIEWRYDEELEWFLLQYDMHRSFQHFTEEANRLYRAQAALWEDDGGWNGFEWIDVDNREQSVLCYQRRGRREEDHLLVVVNMTPACYPTFRLGVPAPSSEDGDGATEAGGPAIYGYEPIFNSDESAYGGSGQGNAPLLPVEAIPWHSRPASIELTVPPLCGLILKPVRRDDPSKS